MSRNFDSSARVSNTSSFSRYAPLQLDFENQILITSNTTFVVPPNTKAVKFTAVGGGQAGVGTTSGPGAGYFEKTFYGPFIGLTTSFQLTIGAANGGNTILANSAGTTIATAFGATAIGAGATVGVGGTASGGDINTQGSPGGITPGVGGASGGTLGNSVYNPTYAGRWIYFQESLINDNVRNYLVNTLEASRGSRITAIGFNTLGTITAQYGAAISNSGPGATVAGLFANGQGGTPTPFGGTSGGAGGFGGNGGPGTFTPGGNYTAGGPGGFGGNGGDGGSGGAGGYGGNGGNATNPNTAPSGQGNGGAGGYGGAGGSANPGRNSGLVPQPSPPFVAFTGATAGGSGGPGGFGGGGGRSGNGGTGSGPNPYIPPAIPAASRNGGPGGPGGPGGYGGGAGAAGLGGAASGGPAAGADGVVGNGGPGAVYIEWTMKEPNKLGV